MTHLLGQSITCACPPSIAFACIDRYFEVRGKMATFRVTMDDEVPLVEQQVVVGAEPHPNRLTTGRYDDRFELRWYLPQRTQQSFRGRLTIRPAGTETTLLLKGFGQPQRASSDAGDQLAAYDQIVHATGYFLLAELKIDLEAAYERLQEQPVPAAAPVRERRARARPGPTSGTT